MDRHDYKWFLLLLRAVIGMLFLENIVKAFRATPEQALFQACNDLLFPSGRPDRGMASVSVAQDGTVTCLCLADESYK